MKNLNKNLCLSMLLIFSFAFTFNSSPVKAQEENVDEEYLDDEYIDDGYQDEFYDENFEAEGFDDGFETSELYSNAEGLEDPDGIYQLDNITAETFQKISNIERENALMKLKIEQGKLKLDLEKQKAEKKKIEANAEEEERQRQIKQEEQERKLALERKKQQELEEKEQEEKEKKAREKEISDKLLEKINSADLSNPDDIKVLTQLMSLTTGKNVSDLGAAKLDTEEVPFDEKYTVKSIMGAGGNLVANVENTVKKTTFKVKVGSMIDEWVVEDIRGTSVLLKKGNEVKVMNLN